MSEVGKAAGVSKSTMPRLCSFCSQVLNKQITDVWEYPSRSPTDLQNTAKLGCFICGWVVLLIRQKEVTEQLEVESIGIDWDESRSAYLNFSFDFKPGKLEFLSRQPVPMFCVINDSGHIDVHGKHEPMALPHFGDTHVRKLAMKWLGNCRENHQTCRATKDTFLPSRLIRIVDVENATLVCSTQIDGMVDYATLSYCWGGSQTLTLSVNNYIQLSISIQVRDLPQTLQEAILACIGLGIQYIWIDCLCIIQDSDRDEDWKKEAATMGSIYENAALNLCMAGSARSSESSYQTRDANLIKPLHITSNRDDKAEKGVHMVCTDSFDYDIVNCPLRKRGWVFQEWFLAKRSLVFGQIQLWWHCREQLANETFPDGIPDDASVKYKPPPTVRAYAMKDTSLPAKDNMKIETRDKTTFKSNTKKTISSTQNKETDTLEVYERWWQISSQYAETRFTYESDRVIAFSGIAQAFRTSHNLNARYLAGIWQGDFPAGLMWSRIPEGIAEARRSLEYKAPSWSWMSIDGPYSLSGGEGPISQTFCSIEQTHLHLEDDKHDTGLLCGGSLEMRGRLIGPFTHDLISWHDVDQIDGWSFKVEEGDNYQGRISWDEQDSKMDTMISYLEALQDSTLNRSTTKTFRKRLSLKDTKASFFLLPVAHATEGIHSSGVSLLTGMILYQAPYQTGMYHRVGLYEIYVSVLTDFTKVSQDKYPLRSFLIF
ncbi:heterokaryon incompatibility protein-domain-containing protein [Fusarium avenaceum]|nr:heterokaryon incompatibility protein-domain-containing protein [Fusarium avenaceum]